jgi:hypothetical protein
MIPPSVGPALVLAEKRQHLMAERSEFSPILWSVAAYFGHFDRDVWVATAMHSLTLPRRRHGRRK